MHIFFYKHSRGSEITHFKLVRSFGLNGNSKRKRDEELKPDAVRALVHSKQDTQNSQDEPSKKKFRTNACSAKVKEEIIYVTDSNEAAMEQLRTSIGVSDTTPDACQGILSQAMTLDHLYCHVR